MGLRGSMKRPTWRRSSLARIVLAGLTAAAITGALSVQASAAPGDPRTASDERIDFPVVAPEAAEAYPEAITVVPADDLDADGIDDLLVRLPPQLNADGLDSVAAVKGGRGRNFGTAPRILLRVTSANGFDGPLLAGAEDFDGDGVGELAMATDDGAIVVVRGASDGATIDAEDPGNRGFVIEHADASGKLGVTTMFTVPSRTLITPGNLDRAGAPEVAWVSSGNGAEIFFPPADPMGKRFDVEGADRSRVELLSAPSRPSSEPTVLGAPGDLDGDGSDDLAIFWHPTKERMASTIVLDQRAGSESALASIPSEGRGYSFGAEGEADQADVVADLNRDGNRDIVMPGPGGGVALYGGERGEARGVDRLQAGEGTLGAPSGKPLHDGGDLDGDGRNDLLTNTAYVLTEGVDPSGDPSAQRWHSEEHELARLGSSVELVASVSDRNGDSLPELLTTHYEPYGFQEDAERWVVQTFHSRAWTPVEPGTAVPDGQFIRFTGQVPARHRPDPALRDPGLQVTVEGTIAGNRFAGHGGSYDPTTGKVEASTPQGAEPNQTHQLEYRLKLTSGSGATVGRSPITRTEIRPTGRFVIRGTGEADRLAGTPDEDVIIAQAGPDRLRGKRSADLLKGGRGRDRLTGNRGRDELKGNRGRDRLKGNRGRDELKGGRGKDVLIGGKGAEVLRCGKGRDVARNVGRRDVVRSCERIRRK